MTTETLRFTAFIVAASALSVFFHFYDSRRVDIVILIAIGVGSVLAVLVMLLARWQWRIRRLGLLGTMVGLGVLFTAWGINAHRHERTPEWALDIARGYLVAGVALFMVGIIEWFWHNRPHDELPVLDAEDV